MISDIRLDDFRVFKGTNCIAFDREKSVSVIASTNAAGKTTLLASIYWCLYGELPEEIETSFGPLLNCAIANETEEGNTSQTAVTLTIQINGQTFQLCRSVSYDKISGELCVGGEHTFFNQSQDDPRFSAFVNDHFPRKYAPVFFWQDVRFYRTDGKLKIEECFTQKEMDSIIGQANRIFNGIYFRPGKYELLYRGQLLVKEMNTGVIIEPSMEDSLMMNMSVFLAACIFVRTRQSEMLFPLLIDHIFGMVHGERARKAIDVLFNTCPLQIIMAENHWVIDGLNLAKGHDSKVIIAHELRLSRVFSASINGVESN